MQYDAILVLSTSIKNKDGVFPNFMNGMYLGGQVRMDAAAKLANESSGAELTIVGGYNELGKGDLETSDKVNDIADFLYTNAPHTKLHLIDSLPCTHHNFVAVFNFWKAHDLQPNNIGILSNSYHLPRALEFANQYKSEGMNFTGISAEDILGKSVGEIVGDRVKEYEARLKYEANGLEMLRSGTYQDFCLTQDLDNVMPILHIKAKELLTADEFRLLPAL